MKGVPRNPGKAPASADLREIAVADFLAEVQFLTEKINVVLRPAVGGHEGPQRLDSRLPAVITAVNKGLVAGHLRIDLVLKAVDLIENGLIGQRTFPQPG